MDRLSGRVAVVTGASSGIGAQIASDLARAGLVVVGVARRLDRLQELAATLEGAGGKLHPIKADLSSVEEIQRVYKWVDENLGGVSIVINNAAILTNESIANADPQLLKTLVSTNLTAVMISSQEAIKSMQKHQIEDGHILNINSVAGHKIVTIPSSSAFSTTAYAASKHGITAFSEGLRYDVQKIPGFKIRVTSLSPGAVATEALPAELVDRLEDPTVLLHTKDVSNAVLYVLSCPTSVEITELRIQPTGEAF